MKQRHFLLLAAALVLAACSRNTGEVAQVSSDPVEELQQAGDSTYYGLACEGCNDSVIIVLPFSGNDPDTFNVLQAVIERRVLGRPHIGDQLAVIADTADASVARLVVNLSALKGEWCQLVTPHFRQRPVSDSLRRSQTALPDSLRRRWLQPRECGFEIRPENVVFPIGNVRPGADGQNDFVEYPPVKQYRQWNFFNGHLILSETRRDSLGRVEIVESDTADVVFLRNDSLRLRIGEDEQGYYRRKQ